jgi:hypothetical protein
MSGEAVDRKGIDNTEGHGLILWTGECDLHFFCLQDAAAFDNSRNFGNRLVGRIFNKRFPVTVIRPDSRLGYLQRQSMPLIKNRRCYNNLFEEVVS